MMKWVAVASRRGLAIHFIVQMRPFHSKFDTWRVHTEDNYNEQMIQAMWIGFAHLICELYHENEPEA